MNRTELVEAIASNVDASISKKDIDKVIKSFMDVATTTLQSGESIQLVGFGTFSIVNRSARTAKNPQTGEPIKIKACKAPKFKPGKALKAAVNEKPKKKGKK